MNIDKRQNLRWPLKHFPRWLLVGIAILVGYPLAAFIGALKGASEGIGDMSGEIKEIWNIGNED